MTTPSNNIKPWFWGKNFWAAIFSIASVYPDDPDKEQIKYTKLYLLSLRKTLPCGSCRESYTRVESRQAF